MAAQSTEVSKHLSRVYFNEPIFLELSVNPRGDVEQLREYTWKEREQFYDVCEAEGFGTRAIVAQKPESWKANSPIYWGVVTGLTKSPEYQKPYAPIEVKWVDGKASKHWPEELWLIHRAIPIADINLLVEAQK